MVRVPNGTKVEVPVDKFVEAVKGMIWRIELIGEGEVRDCKFTGEVGPNGGIEVILVASPTGKNLHSRDLSD